MEATLRGGPQDGVKVRGNSIPQTLYLQASPNEDGYAPWLREPNFKFPCRYTWRNNHYVFDEQIINPSQE